MNSVSKADEILDDLRRVAKTLDKGSLTLREYIQHGRFSEKRILGVFSRWNEAVRAAGLLAIAPRSSRRQPTPDDALQSEFMRVYSSVGRAPSHSEFSRLSKFSYRPYARRFGTWRNAVAHYLGPETARTVADRKATRVDDDVLRAEFMRVYAALGKIPTMYEFNKVSKFSKSTYAIRFGGWRSTVEHYLGRPADVRPPKSRRGRGTVALATPAGRRVFGPPLNFRGLRHEPVNEQGVVLLFGMVAHELGFLVDAVATGFPDCKAKRLIRRGQYVEVDIEFEFRSSGFRDHGHDASKCDLVVCWRHDWQECPVEVLELRSAIKKLPSRP